MNLLLSLLSLNAAVVILERLSPTTKIFLPPYNFLRLHEVVQMLAVIPISFIISYFILKIVTDDFRLLKGVKGSILASLFIMGLYLTATGNGAHEVAGYVFNTFCNAKIGHSTLCGGMFFNDYYFGNIVYFVGMALSNIVLILFERDNPAGKVRKKDIVIPAVNGVIYALTLFAYGAFDPVVVGFGFCVGMTAITIPLLLTAKTKPTKLPFTLYSTLAYTLSTLAILMVRFG